ncbi:thioesterase family protein [Cumulibacter manganitolerans]|uniref:thioesterase family protein n=1 Tax=Cumulibacter manganitolerans TaxID=1884992 RepID=UPI001294B009|nr:thioesterase family protein [Cumulibacter manganitolerans]
MSESMTGVEAFYLPADGGRYQPTYATMSPWDGSAQHGGPPSALLAHAMTDLVDPSLRLARISVDFLGVIPRKPCVVRAEITRPGRRICRTEATMTVDDRVVAAASAWHIVTGAEPPARGVHDYRAPELPDEQPQRFFVGLTDWGYGEAIEWRFTHGSLDTPGPAAVWSRLRVPLVASRETSGLERLIVVADSANGLSNELPLGDWLFIPPTLTVTALRAPVGEWVFVDATTTLSADGLGLSTAQLADSQGLCGTAAQPLLVSAT